METYYIYAGHLGGYYWSLEDLEEDNFCESGEELIDDDSEEYDEYYYDDPPLYCDQCGDSDDFIGTLESPTEPTESQMKKVYDAYHSY